MNIQAKDIMSTEVIAIEEGTSIEEALKLLVNARITGIPVVDKKCRMIGIFSDYDVICQIKNHPKVSLAFFQKAIEFTPKVIAVEAKTTLNKIVELFVESRFRRLPVTNSSGKLIGIVTRRDLMKLFFYQATLSDNE